MRRKHEAMVAAELSLRWEAELKASVGEKKDSVALVSDPSGGVSLRLVS